MNPFRTRLAALAVGAAFAHAAAAGDFLETYRLAKRNDATFAAARAALEAGLEKLPQGRALLLPVINASASTNYNDAENRTFGSEARFNSNGWNVTLTQPIFRWQNIVQYEQSKFQVLQAEAQFAQATQDLIVRVAQAYFEVLAARDNIDFIKSNKIAIAEQLAQAKRNFEVGTATITDTNEAQARFDLATAQEIAGFNALEVAERALQQIIGEPPTTLTPLRPNVLIAPPQPAVMDEWAKSARASNLVVRANEAVFEIAEREVGRQRAGHYPTLDAIATAQENTNQSLAIGVGTRSTVQQNIIGLQLNLPIFAGGAVVSRTREAVALKERARSDLEASRRAAEFNARQAYLNVTNGLAQVKALEQALTSSEVSLQSNRVGYEVGVRINIDVLNAQQQVFQTKRDLARARYDTILSGLRLKAAAGALTEADVEELNRLLGEDPAATKPKPTSSAPREEGPSRAAPIVPGGLNLSMPGQAPAHGAARPNEAMQDAPAPSPPAPRSALGSDPIATIHYLVEPRVPGARPIAPSNAPLVTARFDE
jgi:outer membrane protein